ncbi:hypothetical protein EBT16_09420, partial [bacterium]|nr:hypothetical protein [bacterium]
MDAFGFSVEEIDKLTGTVIGHPKSATFRTADVVGLDTLFHVTSSLATNLIADECKEVFKPQAYLEEMVNQKWLGDKTGQGFYKKTKTTAGEREILSLNLKKDTDWGIWIQKPSGEEVEINLNPGDAVLYLG